MNDIVQTIFSCTYIGKNNFVDIEDFVLQHLNGVANLLSKTRMKVVKFSVFVWMSTLLPIFKVAFLSFQKPVCMVFSAHFFDGGFLPSLCIKEDYFIAGFCTDCTCSA